MRDLPALASGITVAFAAALTACDQDYAASNSDRETFMGNVRAAEVASREPSSAVDAAPPPAIVQPPLQLSVPLPSSAPSGLILPAPAPSGASPRTKP
jgi:hypothetical protein